jgi:hypothetical protein
MRPVNLFGSYRGSYHGIKLVVARCSCCFGRTYVASPFLGDGLPRCLDCDLRTGATAKWAKAAVDGWKSWRNSRSTAPVGVWTELGTSEHASLEEWYVEEILRAGRGTREGTGGRP